MYKRGNSFSLQLASCELVVPLSKQPIYQKIATSHQLSRNILVLLVIITSDVLKTQQYVNKLKVPN